MKKLIGILEKKKMYVVRESCEVFVQGGIQESTRGSGKPMKLRIRLRN